MEKKAQSFGADKSRVAALPHRKEPVEMVQASGEDASLTPPSRGVSNWVVSPGQVTDTVERLCLSAGVGKLQYSP